MPVYTLTILDTVAIQTYIFGSNRLRENIGASELVKRSTEAWVYQALPQPNNSLAADQKKRIEADQLKAEVIYAGGGNTLILFESDTEAKTFAATLSQRLLLEAPGIELAVVHLPFTWESDALAGNNGLLDQAFRQLAEVKGSRATHQALAGLGVTAVCQSTGQVAVATNEAYRASKAEKIYPISAEVAAKLRVEKEVPRNFRGGLDDSGFEMISNFDEIGSKEEASYLAVVHIDGNGMGKRVEEISTRYASPADNRVLIEALREFSTQVRTASTASILTMELALIKSVETDKNSRQKIGGKVPVEDKKIPYRLLISGGDDLTFVCDGRLALSLATAYLRAFEQETAAAGLANIHACAGIAVVKSHYPFARAYELAGNLCDNAKRWVKDSNQDFSALDWHFAPSGLMGGLKFIRKREYAVSEGTLIMRPVALTADQAGWRNWPKFEAIVTEFRDGWAEQRNKVIQLREALRAGKDAVRQFRVAYKTSLPKIDPTITELQDSGWAGGQCGYFDAIEAMDFYVSVEQEGSPA